MAISRSAPGVPQQDIDHESFHHFKAEIEVSLTEQDIAIRNAILI
jgi:transposase InsO family protein